MQVKLLLIFCFLPFALRAQYAPQAGVSGSTAISKTSASISGWATGCTVKRGLQQIDNPSLGYASSGDSSLAIGPADGSVVSLGDSGVATVTFSNPIINGTGADFAVYENGFANPSNPEEAFLELGFVEVSSDGIHFFRFPATSLTPDTSQLSSTVGANYMNARLLNNLAGKYIAGYGTPFDLQELDGITGLDINHITHIRIIDVIGSIGLRGTMDNAGHKINDPFPTAFATGGFDLDGVAALHQSATGVGHLAQLNALTVYPNPATDKVVISFKMPPANAVQLRMTNAMGRIVLQTTINQSSSSIDLSGMTAGMYYLIATDAAGNQWAGTISKQ